MDVTFVKRGTGYEVLVRREKGPELAPRGGPGASPTVPHDAAHMIGEIEDGLRGGVFGRLAAADGLDGLFWPADPVARKKASRNTKRPTAEQSEDMRRSEYLASLTVALWEVERGLRAPDRAWPGTVDDADLTPELVRRLYARYDAFAAAWKDLPDGGELTLAWPGEVRGGSRKSGRRG
ncbi:hypothetical protein [Tsukamurella sp. 1534]|uniref:hypothetical protein n=1 Tax=Tsukamurella sp. 1534 TaxID=1151061 RepID=UPI0002FF63F2|nr:hypothetical protein [Tsukamurella sp. 1534]